MSIVAFKSIIEPTMTSRETHTQSYLYSCSDKSSFIGLLHYVS